MSALKACSPGDDARREREAIARCISACAQATDGRGRWRHRRELAEQLSGSPAVRVAVAEAAERLGAWIKGVGR